MARILFLLVSVSCLFFSCKDFDDLSAHTQLILKNEAMLFRGANFDEDKAKVLEVEPETPVEEYPDYLRYTYKSETEKNELEVEYFFNNDNRLDMIIAYYTLQSEEAQKLVFDELVREFTKRFGPGEKDELGWYIWKFKDKVGVPGQIEIILNMENERADQLGIDIEFVKYYDFEQNMSLEELREG